MDITYQIISVYLRRWNYWAPYWQYSSWR